MRAVLVLFAAAMTLLAAPASAETSKSGASVRIDGATGPVFAAGGAVEVDGRITAGGMRALNGVFAAGGSVGVGADIDGALYASGGEVRFTGRARRAMLAGGDVTLAGEVDKDAHLAGANLAVAPQAVIGGDLGAAGGYVRFDGATRGDADLAGGEVHVNGSIAGDLELTGETLVIGPDARIGGNLRYYADSEIDIPSTVRIGGEVQYRNLSEREVQRRVDRQRGHAFGAKRLHHSMLGAAFWFVVDAASGAALALLFPGWLGAVAAAGRGRPLVSLLTGFAGVIVAPVAAVLLMLIVLGIPLGGGLLAIWGSFLLLGGIGAGFALGHLLLDRTDEERPKILFLLAGLAIVMVLGAAPYIGWIFSILAAAYGFGALTLGLWSRLAPRAA